VKKIVARSLLPTMGLVVVALVAAGSYALIPAGAASRASASTPSPAATASPSDSPSTSPSTTTSPSDSPSTSPSPTASPTPPPPLRVVAVWPRAKARNVSFASAIKVRFSAALATDTPLPKLTPKVPGSWRIVGGVTLVFVPKGHLPIYTKVYVTLPGGVHGVWAVDGARLKAGGTFSFTVGGPSSTLRLQQLLAELGYLPLRFEIPVVSPASGSQAQGTTAKTKYVSAIAREPRSLDLLPLKPRTGIFVWRYRHIPRALAALWRPRRSTTLIRGAVMAFESDHRLADDGVVGRKVWIALLKATARHSVSKRAYDYIEVSTSIPETLRVWRNGRVIYSSATNTGIAARPTPHGTFVVYARFLSTTMSGTNPNGSHYSDPGVPYVAYFNGGDAVHGFSRGSYGWPQSLGCVELPYGPAAVVFRYDPIGTLVTVS